MIIEDLQDIIDKENYDSQIIAMTIVVKDSNSQELTVYNLDKYGIDSFKVEE